MPSRNSAFNAFCNRLALANTIDGTQKVEARPKRTHVATERGANYGMRSSLLSTKYLLCLLAQELLKETIEREVKQSKRKKTKHVPVKVKPIECQATTAPARDPPHRETW
ncbi:hypothetical protein M422DRAFT_271851 [Sphaerobolus stellatus SS14]|uniref:Uncharacterized protein n=1 Tax=Sphaerobolus stellatus (strain SS14) TaxID=990650 RepID=A0A0C9UNI0_SPHS4|nr:hypothetical protein M422DRAFT_271851 [Sphaerobolus stellatus SS14]